jgi:uncharacterized membrane protein YhaH (DUF805 family)
MLESISAWINGRGSRAEYLFFLTVSAILTIGGPLAYHEATGARAGFSNEFEWVVAVWLIGVTANGLLFLVMTMMLGLSVVMETDLAWPLMLWALVLSVASALVTCRRLRGAGRAPEWFLIGQVPALGLLVTVYLALVHARLLRGLGVAAPAGIDWARSGEARMQKSIIDYYVYGLTKGYFLFSGRARRREFWLYALASVLVGLVLMLIENVALGGTEWLSWLYVIATLIPGIAVSVRRLHDIDRTGWWYLILLVPIVGVIVFFVFAATAGNPGENRFGPDPKAEPEPLPA